MHSQYERLRAALTEARQQSELTQSAVASRLRKPQSFVSKYESGERRLDVIEFVAVCRALAVDPVLLLKKVIRENAQN